MAADGYSVGNLKIAFNALDQTSDDFKKLATNLRAIVNLINRISTADLGKFSANVKEITKAFNPFLTKLEKSTTGLQAFDSIAKQLGVKNISNVATVFDHVRKTTHEAEEGVAKFNTQIIDGKEAADDYAKDILNVATAAAEIKNPFDAAQAEVAKLTHEMLNLHFDTGSLDNDKIKKIRDLTSDISASQNAVKQALMSEEELVIEKYKDIQATRKQRIAYLEAELAMGASGKQARQYAKELAELRKQDGQVGKKSGFAKFLGQIKRVAIYRLIRTGLKAVTSAFKDGISALAQFDSGVNKTMSQLTTSFTVMKLSVSTALLPLLEAITPIIQQISAGFANMANVISASMSKTGYYTKINTDRLLAYNKAANLFDFDKFRALNKGDEAMNLLSKEKVEDGNEELENTKNIIQSIKDIISSVFGIINGIWQVVQPLLTGVVLPVLGAVLPLISEIIRLVSSVLSPALETVGRTLSYLFDGILGDVVKQIASAISFIVKILKGDLVGAFKEVGNIFISIPNFILGAIEFLVNAGIKILNNFTSALSKTWTWLNYFGLNLSGIPEIPYVKLPRIDYYANGGIPDKGSMFVAGEHGAEFVYNIPSGQSGVANIQQIAQAVYQGTYQATMDWWKSARNDIPQFQEASATGIYQVVKGEMRRRGERPVKA